MKSKAIFYSTVSLFLLSIPVFSSRDDSDAEAYGNAFNILRDMKKEEKRYRK